MLKELDLFKLLQRRIIKIKYRVVQQNNKLAYFHFQNLRMMESILQPNNNTKYQMIKMFTIEIVSDNLGNIIKFGLDRTRTKRLESSSTSGTRRLSSRYRRKQPSRKPRKRLLADLPLRWLQRSRKWDTDFNTGQDSFDSTFVHVLRHSFQRFFKGEGSPPLKLKTWLGYSRKQVNRFNWNCDLFWCLLSHGIWQFALETILQQFWLFVLANYKPVHVLLIYLNTFRARIVTNFVDMYFME